MNRSVRLTDALILQQNGSHRKQKLKKSTARWLNAWLQKNVQSLMLNG